MNPLKWALVWGASGPAYLWFLWVRWALGGLGALALAKRLGQGPSSAFLVALLWSFSAPLLLHFNFPDVHAFVLLPWLLLLVEAGVAQPGLATASALGSLAGLTAWLGHVEGAFFTGLGAGAIWLGAWCRSPRRWEGMGWGLVALAFAVAVAAPVWWPLWAFMAEAQSYHQDPEGFRRYLLQSAPLWAVFKSLPKLALWPWSALHPYWFNPYITSVGALLACFGLWGASPARRVAASLLGGWLACLVLFQPTAPMQFLPLSPLSYYAGPLATLALALLAGQGLAWVVARQARWALGGGLLLLALAAARGGHLAALAAQQLALAPQSPPPAGVNAWPMLAPWAGLALAAWVFWPRPWALAWVRPALLGACLAEAWVYASLACPTVPFGGYPWPAHWPPRASLAEGRVGLVRLGALSPDLGAAHGIRQFDLLEAWVLRRYQAFVAVANPDPPEGLNVWVAGRGAGAAGRLLDLASVTHLVQRDAQGRWQLQARPSALPRVRWLDAQVGVAGSLVAEEAALRQGAARWAKTLLVALPPGHPGWAWAKGLGPGEAARIQWLEDRPNRLAWRVRSPQPGWLVLADQHASGWSAEVDGQPAPIFPAYVALRAVPVPAGEHVVRMRYWPQGLGLALGLAALAWLVTLALAWRALRRRRRLGARQGPAGEGVGA